MNYEDILYLDPGFLAEKFEEKTGLAPRTVISRNEGMDAQAGISFLKSSLHSQVTKQFTSSNQTMLKATSQVLDEYPKFTPNLKLGLRPCNAWVAGALTIGRWENEGNDKNPQETLNVFFEVKSGCYSYSLLPQNEFFLANLEVLEVISPALQRYIQIPVRMLCKVLYPLPDIKTFVVTPYLVCATDG